MQAESITEVSRQLIQTDFYRNIKIMIKKLSYEKSLPSPEEKLILGNLDSLFENTPLIVDCMDCKFRNSIQKDAFSFLYNSYKVGCGKGLRLLEMCDPKGEIRYVGVGYCGCGNDQSLLASCANQNPGILLPHEKCLADGGFTTVPNFTVIKPANARQVQSNHSLATYNSALSSERVLIENVFGLQVKLFPILKSYGFDKDFFPQVMLVTALLLNRYFRLYGYIRNN